MTDWNENETREAEEAQLGICARARLLGKGALLYFTGHAVESLRCAPQ
jgi:hypothetical protein